MTDLVEFLRARIDEDEEFARDAAGWDHSGRERANGRWHTVGVSSVEDDREQSVIFSDNDQLSGTVADYVAHWDPARVLAECEAKRQIIDRHEELMANARAHPLDQPSSGAFLALQGVLKMLALPNADHPDYREEWRP